MITLLHIKSLVGIAATLLLRDSLTKKPLNTIDVMEFTDSSYFKINCHKKVRVTRTPRENVYIVYLWTMHFICY